CRRVGLVGRAEVHPAGRTILAAPAGPVAGLAPAGRLVPAGPAAGLGPAPADPAGLAALAGPAVPVDPAGPAAAHAAPSSPARVAAAAARPCSARDRVSVRRPAARFEPAAAFRARHHGVG